MLGKTSRGKTWVLLLPNNLMGKSCFYLFRPSKNSFGSHVSAKQLCRRECPLAKADSLSKFHALDLGDWAISAVKVIEVAHNSTANSLNAVPMTSHTQTRSAGDSYSFTTRIFACTNRIVRMAHCSACILPSSNCSFANYGHAPYAGMHVLRRFPRLWLRKAMQSTGCKLRRTAWKP